MKIIPNYKLSSSEYLMYSFIKTNTDEDGMFSYEPNYNKFNDYIESLVKKGILKQIRKGEVMIVINLPISIVP